MLLVLSTEIGSKKRFWKYNIEYKLMLEVLSYLPSPYTIVSISQFPSSSKQIFRKKNNKVYIHVFKKYLLGVYCMLSTALGDYIASSE